jgi:hypothetical protein
VGGPEGRHFHPVELIAEIPPGVLAEVLDDPRQEQTQHREADVGMDPVGHPVIDRPEADAALQFPPALFHREEVFVPQSHVLGRERIVIGGDHERPEFATAALDVHPSRNFKPGGFLALALCRRAKGLGVSGPTAHVAHALSFRYP